MKLFIGTCLFLLALVAGTALAAPASVAGTWSGIDNGGTVTIVLTENGGSPCKAITGTIGGVQHVRGFYCPNTGHITFAYHSDASSTEGRVYVGSLATDSGTQRMAGTSYIFDSALGPKGEYPFQLTK